MFFFGCTGRKQQSSPKVNKLLSTEEIICTAGFNKLSACLKGVKYELISDAQAICTVKPEQTTTSKQRPGTNK